MNELDFLNNFSDAVCAFSDDKEIVFKNAAFNSIFPEFKGFNKFKKRFNFNLCFLSSENLMDMTPLDVLLSSKESFHTTCTYQNLIGNYTSYYVYKFLFNNYIVIHFIKMFI